MVPAGFKELANGSPEKDGFRKAVVYGKGDKRLLVYRPSKGAAIEVDGDWGIPMEWVTGCKKDSDKAYAPLPKPTPKVGECAATPRAMCGH